jgi:hypothetical protein
MGSVEFGGELCVARDSTRNSYSGGAGRIRTADKQFRKLLLYPSELQPRSLKAILARRLGWSLVERLVEVPQADDSFW